MQMKLFHPQAENKWGGRVQLIYIGFLKSANLYCLTWCAGYETNSNCAGNETDLPQASSASDAPECVVSRSHSVSVWTGLVGPQVMVSLSGRRWEDLDPPLSPQCVRSLRALGFKYMTAVQVD